MAGDGAESGERRDDADVSLRVKARPHEEARMPDEQTNDDNDDLAALHDGVHSDDIEYMFAQTATGVVIADGRSTRGQLRQRCRPRVSDPVASNGDLSSADEVTDGELVPSVGPVSLFIDMIGRPMTPMSVAGVRRRAAAGGCAECAVVCAD